MPEFSVCIAKQPSLSGTFPSNLPSGGNNVRVVVVTYCNSGNGFQEYIATHENGVTKWHRSKYNSAWKSWTLEYKTQN